MFYLKYFIHLYIIIIIIIIIVIVLSFTARQFIAMEGQTAAATVSVIGGSRDRGNITLGFNVTLGNATGTCILNIYNYVYVLYVITSPSHSSRYERQSWYKDLLSST